MIEVIPAEISCTVLGELVITTLVGHNGSVGYGYSQMCLTAYSGKVVGFVAEVASLFPSCAFSGTIVGFVCSVRWASTTRIGL